MFIYDMQNPRRYKHQRVVVTPGNLGALANLVCAHLSFCVMILIQSYCYTTLGIMSLINSAISTKASAGSGGFFGVFFLDLKAFEC